MTDSLWRVLSVFPGLRARRGDRVAEDPQHPGQFIRWRPKVLSDSAAVRAAMAAGVVVLATLDASDPGRPGSTAPLGAGTRRAGVRPWLRLDIGVVGAHWQHLLQLGEELLPGWPP